MHNLGRPTVLWSLLLFVTLSVGCNRSTTVSSSGDATAPVTTQTKQVQAKITASPNPVPAGTGLGSTTIMWDTGDRSWGQIYIVMDGVETKMLAEGSKGVKEVNWIQTGIVYEFRLY